MTDAPVIALGSFGLDTDVMDNFLGKEANSTKPACASCFAVSTTRNSKSFPSVEAKLAILTG
jgi:hypothetical protein